MVYISIEINGNYIIMHCHKNAKDGEYFTMVVDSDTKKLVERPDDYDMDMSVAYSCIYSLLRHNKPIPKETVAAWG